MRRQKITGFALLLMSLVPGRALAPGIGGHYSGRYLCNTWNSVDLQIAEEGGGKISGVFKFPVIQGGGNGAYAMIGQYNERSGQFLLQPQKWIGAPPRGYSMVGMVGRFDAATRRLTGKIDTLFCGVFELAGDGGVPLPAGPPPMAPTQHDYATNPVQNGLEYWDNTMTAPAGAPRESEPIDEVIDWMRAQKYSCLASYPVSWDANGTKGSANSKLSTRARFVVQCEGDCRGLRYAPYTTAQVYQFGRTKPMPVMEMKSNWFGGTPVQWVLTRPSGGKPPDLEIGQSQLG
jgi:hypothetical protein